MNTQTHLLIAAALFCRPGKPVRNAAVLAGGFVPDLGVYGLFAWSKLSGVDERVVWREIYFAEPMQTVQAVFNSVPLYAVLLIAGWLILSRMMPEPAAAGGALAGGATVGPRSPEGGWWDFVEARSALGLFALAALVHLAGDLPVHADDAHRHFWPFSDWRFHSPVSYWDGAHGGDWFSWLEAGAGLALVALLWRRFAGVLARLLLALAVILYVGVPLYFWWQLGGG